VVTLAGDHNGVRASVVTFLMLRPIEL